jgi:hypothetical protein
MSEARKIILLCGGVVLAFILIWIAIFAIGRWQQSAGKARVAEAEAGAARGNARDAVATIGTAAAREGESETLTRENDDAIRSAPGGDAPVAAGVHDAGLDSLCRRAAYRDDPECVQRAAAR